MEDLMNSWGEGDDEGQSACIHKIIFYTASLSVQSVSVCDTTKRWDWN